MTWWRPWKRLRHNGHEDREAADALAQAKRARNTTRRMTPVVEQEASRVADLPDEEFVARVARAFRPRST